MIMTITDNRVAHDLFDPRNVSVLSHEKIQTPRTSARMIRIITGVVSVTVTIFYLRNFFLAFVILYSI